MQLKPYKHQNYPADLAHFINCMCQIYFSLDLFLKMGSDTLTV